MPHEIPTAEREEVIDRFRHGIAERSLSSPRSALKIGDYLAHHQLIEARRPQAST